MKMIDTKFIDVVKNSPFLLLLFCLMLISACASPQPPTTISGAKKEVISTPKDPDEPCWIKDVSCKDAATHLAVRGVSRESVNRQDAERDAIKDAQLRAAEILDLDITRIDEEVMSILGKNNKVLPKGIAGDDAYRKLVNAKLRGLRPINYTRRWSVTEYGDTDEKWESFALILVPKDLNTVIAKEVLDEKKAETNDPLVERASNRLDELRKEGWGKMNR